MMELCGSSDIPDVVRDYFSELCPVHDVVYSDVTILSVSEMMRLRDLTVPEMLLWNELRFPVIALEPNHDVYCLIPRTGEIILVPASACLEEPYRLYDWEDEVELDPTEENVRRVSMEGFSNPREFLCSL